MKIMNLVKCEFIKNYTWKKIVFLFLLLLLTTYGTVWFFTFDANTSSNYVDSTFSRLNASKISFGDRNFANDLDKEFAYNRTEKEIEILKILKKLDNYQTIDWSSWQASVVETINKIDIQTFMIDSFKKYGKDSLLVFSNDIYSENYTYLLKENSMETLEIYKEFLLEKREEYIELLLENKFYKYIAYLKEEKENSSILTNNTLLLDDYHYTGYYDYIIDKKFETEYTYQVKNVRQRNGLMIAYSGDSTPYVKRLLKKEENRVAKILDYSIENDLKQDIVYSVGGIDTDYSDHYITSKFCVNQIIHLSIVVMVIVILTSGSIITKEHVSGTEKLLFTSPNKRWKILLSKFIYMILNMYIIWFILLLLLSIYAGMKYGFPDLFTPKIIVSHGHIKEVFYFLDIIKQIFYVSIPVIAMLAILFLVSMISLNTTMVIGLMMAVTVLSPFLWHFMQQYRLGFLAYTPFPYFMYSLVVTFSEDYMKTVALTNIPPIYGIMISLITTFVCYFISHIIYTRRDIKN